MAIVQADLLVKLSGGAANADPNAALGGAMAATEIVDATVHNLFDLVAAAEAAAGDVEYRCFYFENTHGTLTWEDVEVYIDSNTASADTDVAIGLDPAGVGGTATTIANESTAPAGVSFTQPSSGSPLAVGDVAPGTAFAVWVRRTVSAGAAAVTNDEVSITANGVTAA